MTKNMFVSLGVPPARPSEPFPAYDGHIINTIEKAICYAWELLKVSKSINLTIALETEITDALQQSIIDVLNNNLVKGFIPEIFAQPSRDASVSDHTGQFLEKKPDLTFTIPTARPLSVHKGIFFECKPIGSISKYFGSDGLERFCDGRYAWAMPHAGMIGYVQRIKPPISAKEAIEEKVKTGALLVLSHGEDLSATYHPVWVTVHARNFALKNGNAPGSISVRHIWLST
jgi:hypothetical protein